MNLTRRQWIQWTAAAGVGWEALAASRDALRERARKNLKLAVFTGVYRELPVEEAALRIRADGFSGVALEYEFADVRFDPWAPDWTALARITDTLTRHQLPIVCLYGYYNLVDPDEARRKRGEARMQLLIENWQRFKCPLIATETGTLNPKSEWLESPDNVTEAAAAMCEEVLERWAGLAAARGAVIGIEPYWRNIVHSAARTERVFRNVRSPGLRLVMDPCNYFRKEDLARQSEYLDEIFKRVGKHTVLAHAKDMKESADGTDLPAAGKGVLDYPHYLRLLAGLKRELYFVLEHLTLDDVPRARDFVRSQFDRI